MKLKIGVIILCRYNSSRLPGKILREINRKPILEYIVEKIQTVLDRSEIVIATSNEVHDDPIEIYCNNNLINCYRGDLNNVAERFLQASLEYKFDYSIRINGDNIFIDSLCLKQLIEVARSNKYEFISNVKERTFPKGMSIEIVKIEKYKEWIRKFTSMDHFEHVTKYIYEHEQEVDAYFHFNTRVPEAAGEQFAIDTITDFSMAKDILNLHKGSHLEIGLEELIKLKLKVKNG